MAQFRFPELPLSSWQPTRDALQSFALLLSAVRAAYTPRQIHWWHGTLLPSAKGLTTSLIIADEAAPASTFEMLMDLSAHRLEISTNLGEQAFIPFSGQSSSSFCEATLQALDKMSILPEIDRSHFSNTTVPEYDADAVARYNAALGQVALVLKEFRGGLREKTSPINLFPHHFDLAVSWWSGRLIPGQDPNNPEYADELMTYGFSTGDEGIPDPYFYASAYPPPDGFTNAELPSEATWHTEGWTGGLLKYEALAQSEDGKALLLGFLQAVQKAASDRMK